MPRASASLRRVVYDSLAIEVVLIVFMTLSGVSFSIYYLLYTRRRLDVVLDRELITYLAIIVGPSCS